VFHYIKQISNDNDLSITAHLDLACFLAAAHETMLASLKDIKGKQELSGPELRAAWHDRMEMNREPEYREQFFSRVVKSAEQANMGILISFPRINGLLTDQNAECNSFWE
jgi:hypothetical protein